MITSHPLHEQGLGLARSYLKNEREMISVLHEMQKLDLFRKLGFSGPYRYVEKSWGLGEERARLIVGVANLCARAPEVNAAVQAGKITLSKARRIASVIETQQDAETWVQKAMDLDQRELEREVAKTNPEVLIKERIRPV